MLQEALNRPSLFDDLQKGDELSAAQREFFLALAVNHSVLLEHANGQVELAASSPDEQVAHTTIRSDSPTLSDEWQSRAADVSPPPLLATAELRLRAHVAFRRL